jgi:hypothetical protein
METAGARSGLCLSPPVNAIRIVGRTANGSDICRHKVFRRPADMSVE